MLFSVIIPTYRRASALAETLDSLAIQTGEFEVIVVSDGDDEATRALSRRYAPSYPIRWVFHEANTGLAAARNTGARAAHGELLLFLDDDTPACAHLLLQHARHHHHPRPHQRIEHQRDVVAQPRVAVYGKIIEDRPAPLISATDKHLQRTWENTLRDMASRIGATGEASIGAETERTACFGLNCSIRRDVFQASGGFNPKFRYMDEEMELGHRLYISGVQFRSEPRAAVRHRNTKPPTEYFRRCWKLRGEIDAERVLELGQRNPQTKPLGALHRRGTRKWIARTFWHGNRAMKRLASELERASNYAEWPALTGAWARFCEQADYWDGVKSKRFAPEALRSAVGSANGVLCLHSISEPKSDEEAAYYLSPRRFQRFMKWFRAGGYDSASLADWAKGGIPANKLLLTFDDGYDDLYEELLPAVIEYKLKPVIYLVAAHIGQSNEWDALKPGLRPRKLLTLRQITEMRKYGCSFGSHTLTHPWLPHASDSDLRAEVFDSRRRLEDMLGDEIKSFAYPYGGIDQRVRGAVAEAGYTLAFSLIPGLNWWNDPLCQSRAEVSEQTSFVDFAMKLRSGYSRRQWAGAQLRMLQRDLPSPAMRNAARNLERAARRMEQAFQLLSPEPDPGNGVGPVLDGARRN